MWLNSKLNNKGIFGIVKGVGKIIGGALEGDVTKIAKGAARTALGTVTTIASTLTGNSDEIVNNETDDVLDD